MISCFINIINATEHLIANMYVCRHTQYNRQQTTIHNNVMFFNVLFLLKRLYAKVFHGQLRGKIYVVVIRCSLISINAFCQDINLVVENKINCFAFLREAKILKFQWKKVLEAVSCEISTLIVYKNTDIWHAIRI